MANIDYPRMLFHRTQDPVTVHSREQEDALGPGWSRTIWPAKAAASAPAQKPEHLPDPEPEPEPEEQEEVVPIAPRQRPKPPLIKRPVAKGTRKKR
jgi:hypothetical protein